jgi:DNA-binding transcriptional ArsR family regulator
MNENQAISALAGLAHPQRLRAFRALVVAGLPGLTPSTLAEQLDIARNALSFHLKELAHAGLVNVERRGRNLIYRADFSQMDELLGYLTEHCCQGTACQVTDGGTRTATSLSSPVGGRLDGQPPAD